MSASFKNFATIAHGGNDCLWWHIFNDGVLPLYHNANIFRHTNA